HMAPSSLVERYLFRDTDVEVELREGERALTRAFEALWDFAPRTARLAEVRLHAPNDRLVATEQADAACRQLDPKREEEAYRRCHGAAFTAALDLERRLDAQYEQLRARAAEYRLRYRPAAPEVRSPEFPIDAGAELYYLENLPFDQGQPLEARVRTYGVDIGRERAAGRYIHEVWWRALERVCGLGGA